MRAPHARFEHAAAPHRNAVGLRQIMDAQRFAKSAHASELDVEDAAGLQADRLFGVMHGADAFVEADGRIELGLQDA